MNLTPTTSTRAYTITQQTRLWRKTRTFGKRRVQECRAAYRENETPEEAVERRLRESQQVEERVVDIYDYDDFKKEVMEADNSLVVLEIGSQQVCESGFDEEPELQWQQDKKAKDEQLWGMCRSVKHVFQRTARECPDVKFLALDADSEKGSDVCDYLGIDTIPTIQFYKKGQLLWQTKGAMEMQRDLGEGVLYYGDTFAGGKKASEHVKELKSEKDLEEFVNAHDEKNLVVVDMSLSTAQPCIRIFPAVLALARSFQGFASFGRFLGDTGEDCKEVLKKYKVTMVPTFIFFRGGKEIDRLASSSRADLIGHILQIQGSIGISPPPPAGKGERRKRRASK